MALGFFDGVHLGHAAVLRPVAARRSDGLTPLALTFTGRPVSHGAPLILDPQASAREIEKLGCAVVRLDFERARALSPRRFAEQVLRDELHAAFVSCGYNYRFGRNASGSAELLAALCREMGIVPAVRDCFSVDGVSVSSTAVRQAITDGDMPLVRRLLGRLYSYEYPVVEGDRRGRLLDAPTANQFFPDGVLTPRYGVYAALAEIDGQSYPAVTNIGIRPTIGHSRPRSETHILGFDGDLYGRLLRVSLLVHTRDEMLFSDLAGLRAQILSDAEDARRIVGAFRTRGASDEP